MTLKTPIFSQWLVRYGLAVAIMLFALLVRWALVPLIGPGTLYIIVYPAVMIVAVMLGIGPALLGGVLGLVLTEVFLVEPAGHFHVNLSLIVRSAILLATSFYVGWVGEGLRAARQRADRAASELWKRARREELLSDTAAQLLATADPQGLVETLCRKVMECLDCHTFFNFLVDERAGKLRLNACAGLSEGEAREIEWLDYGVAVCGCVARDGKPIVAENIATTPDPRTDLVRAYGVQAYCCHPLMSKGRVIGTLSFGARSRPRFSHEEVALMKAVANLVAMALMRSNDERALRESEWRHRTVADNTYDFEFWLDPEGRFLYTSPSCLRVYGREAAEFMANPALRREVVHPDDRAILDRHVADEIDKRIPGMAEYRIVRPDGAPRWIAHTCQPVFDEKGQYMGVRGSNRDITDRKRAEEALHLAHGRLALALQAAGAGAWDWDLATDKLVWSPELFDLFGLDPAQTEATFDAWQGAMHPEDRQMAGEKIKAAIRDGVRLQNEYRIVLPSGEIRWISAVGETRHDDGGRATRMCGLCFDISRRKADEAAMRRHTEELRLANEDLARFNRAMVDRELRMVELKRQVNDLCIQAGQPPPYDVAFDK